MIILPSEHKNSWPTEGDYTCYIETLLPELVFVITSIYQNAGGNFLSLAQSLPNNLAHISNGVDQLTIVKIQELEIIRRLQFQSTSKNEFYADLNLTLSSYIPDRYIGTLRTLFLDLSRKSDQLKNCMVYTRKSSLSITETVGASHHYRLIQNEMLLDSLMILFGDIIPSKQLLVILKTPIQSIDDINILFEKILLGKVACKRPLALISIFFPAIGNIDRRLAAFIKEHLINYVTKNNQRIYKHYESRINLLEEKLHTANTDIEIEKIEDEQSSLHQTTADITALSNDIPKNKSMFPSDSFYLSQFHTAGFAGHLTYLSSLLETDTNGLWGDDLERFCAFISFQEDIETFEFMFQLLTNELNDDLAINDRKRAAIIRNEFQGILFVEDDTDIERSDRLSLVKDNEWKTYRKYDALMTDILYGISRAASKEFYKTCSKKLLLALTQALPDDYRREQIRFVNNLIENTMDEDTSSLLAGINTFSELHFLSEHALKACILCSDYITLEKLFHSIKTFPHAGSLPTHAHLHKRLLLFAYRFGDEIAFKIIINGINKLYPATSFSVVDFFDKTAITGPGHERMIREILEKNLLTQLIKLEDNSIASGHQKSDLKFSQYDKDFLDKLTISPYNQPLLRKILSKEWRDNFKFSRQVYSILWNYTAEECAENEEYFNNNNLVDFFRKEDPKEFLETCLFKIKGIDNKEFEQEYKTMLENISTSTIT